MHKPELLSPCSSEDTVKAAVYGGADAIYLGLKDFNARMFAKNLDNDRLLRTVEFCHENGVKVYVTMNTLILDKEIQRAVDQAVFLYNSNVDALIVADLGFASLLHNLIPDFELHASTQASGDNSLTAERLKACGFSRMVASRELSKINLKQIVSDSPIEIEMFIHGAICASHSGQCLMSSFIGGRSGNRGACAQPCRMQYNGKYPISFKDMCLANHIKEILDISPASLKIEGRMKGASYVYTVTSIYRKLIDEERNASPLEIKKLADAFSRSGFTDGYFTSHLDSSMLGVRTDKDIERTKNFNIGFLKNNRNLKPITINRNKISGIQIPILNDYDKINRNTARFYDPSAIPDTDYFQIIYLPLEKFDGRKANGIMLPPFITDKDFRIKDQILKAVNNGAENILITNLGQLELIKGINANIQIDYRLNIFNSFSASLFKDFDGFILSPELSLPQMRDIPFKKNVIVYGKVPVMLLEKRIDVKSLRDRKNVSFEVINEFNRDLVLNSVPFYMADKISDMKKNGLNAYHFIFTTESKAEVMNIIDAYKNKMPTTKNIKRIK